MSDILKQGIAVDTHQCNYCSRDKCHSHYYNTKGSCHRDQHKFGIADDDYNESSFNRIAQLQHSAEDLP